METHSNQNRCYRTGKYTVCRRVRASFSPEILQAGAVKGLIYLLDASARGAYSGDSHMRNREKIVGNFSERSRGNGW